MQNKTTSTAQLCGYENGDLLFGVTPLSKQLDLNDETLNKEQQRILRDLECNFNLYNGGPFSDQVHFQGASHVPVQRWYPYREGYSVRLVNTFIKELNITGNVFDPFSGSGTTLLSSRNNNLASFGLDVNPISVLIATVENEIYSASDMETAITKIELLERQCRAEKVYCTNFDLADRVFNYDILQSLLQFKEFILNIDHDKTRNLFYLAWLSIIEETSNIKKEGNGIKYKNRKRTKSGYINIHKETWEKNAFPENKFLFIKRNLINKLKMIIYDIKCQYGHCNVRPKIFNGCCLEFDQYFTDEIELTFFSPPYCNCFDYFEIHKVELWLGGFVKNKESFRALKKTGFRSNTSSINGKQVLYNNEHLERLISLFDFDNLWNKKIPIVIRGYFDDMRTLLNKLHQQTVPGGYIGIVVGNSAYSGTIIPTDLLISTIAKELNFKVHGIFVTRHLTTSSQQKQKLSTIKQYLRESIVLLKK